MQENWYDNDNREESGWYAPAAIPPKPPRRRWLRRALFLCGFSLLLLGLTFLLQKTIGDGANVPADSQTAPDSLPAGDEIPYDIPEDFREYFNGLFAPIQEAEECLIPRVESLDFGLELPIYEKGQQELTYPEIYAKCAPSVVAIHAYVDAENADGFYWGTGFVFSEDGYIITNAHIIEGTSRATVTLWDDSVCEALLVGYDSRNDLAILKIDAENLVAAEFCSSDDMMIGETVVAIGNPLGEQFRSTMTEGIISGTSRDISYQGATLELLQTSAPLNEGNSGGPLINIYGQVIGVTNMKMSSRYSATSIEGLGFAIPSSTVKTLTDAILAEGMVTGRPALGITVGAMPQTARDHYALPEGLYITEVKNGSDCMDKGLVTGDILTAVNGEPVTETKHVLDKIEPLSVGDSLVLSIWRDGEEFDVTVSLVDVNQVY